MSDTSNQQKLIITINDLIKQLPNDDQQQTFEALIHIRELAHKVATERPAEKPQDDSGWITVIKDQDERFLIPGQSFIAYILNRPMYKYRLLESLFAGAILSGIIYLFYLAFVYKF